MPLGLDVRDFADSAVVDELLGGVIELAVAALQADLNDLVGVRLMQGAQTVNFGRGKDERLFAKDVFARVHRRQDHLAVTVII